MANKRIRRKASGGCDSAVGGASGSGGAEGVRVGQSRLDNSLRVYPTVAPTPVTGPITVREQLTAIRGATKQNSGSQFSLSQLSISSSNSQLSNNRAIHSRLQPLQPSNTGSTGNHVRLNRCYSSRGANPVIGGALNPIEETNSRIMNSNIQMHAPQKALISGFAISTDSGHETFCSSPRGFRTSDSKDYMNPSPLLNNNPSTICVAEEFEADKEVAFINSSFGIMTPSKFAAHRKRVARNSPRFLKVSKKSRPSPRIRRSPATNPSLSTGTKPQLVAKKSARRKSPYKEDISEQTACIDALKERQIRLQKMVVTLKRKPGPLMNLKKVLDQTRRVKDEIQNFNECLHDHQLRLTAAPVCSTPLTKDVLSVNPPNEQAVERKPSCQVLAVGSDEAVGDSIPADSFDDLIPEEFMMDETEILGISLDNISAFGDDNVLDFDEETRSSFPEENQFLSSLVTTTMDLQETSAMPVKAESPPGSVYRNFNNNFVTKCDSLEAQNERGVVFGTSYDTATEPVKNCEHLRSLLRTPMIIESFANVSCTTSARMDSPMFLMTPSPSEDLITVAS